MQEENLEERKDTGNVSAKDLFLGTQETYSEAQRRSSEEKRMFQKAEFFRMDNPGVYRLRILPVAPNPDGAIDRKSYEYPVRQLSLELEKPADGEKKEYLYVTVPRATDAGYSLDLIDTYRRLAVETAKERNDEKLAEKIGGVSFGGGLKFNYGHVMYVFDVNNRDKGLQLLTLSHSQFKDLDDKKFAVWQQELAKNPYAVCPVSSVYNACPVEIEKRKNGGSTEYIITIDSESENDALSLKELELLMAAPRIPEVVFRYSRYQMEATVEFLKQCDKKYGMRLFDSEEIQNAIVQLRKELPKADTGSFSFEKRTKDLKANPAGDTITADELFNRFDDLKEKGLDDKTEQGQELRALIRTFIEQERLEVRITRTTSNQEVLDLIQEILEQEGGSGSDDLPF